MDTIFESYKECITEATAAKPVKAEDWAVDADLKKNTVNKSKVHPSQLKKGEHLSNLPTDYAGRIKAIKQKTDKYGYKILRVGNYKDEYKDTKYFVVYDLNGNK